MGKVCSKAQGLRYVDEDDFMGARLGPEGECMSSQDSIPHVSCAGSVRSVNTETCKPKEVKIEARKAVDKKVSGEKDLCTARSSDADKVALLDECDLIVELPPEGQKADEKIKIETDVRIKTGNKDTENYSCYSTKEENQNCSNEPKSRQDEWSYTVYDIDGGSNVTEQDLSHVMHSIRSAIGQSVDPNVCVTAKDSKMLKIKVAVGHHNTEENKTEKKQPRDFSRMILPPPDSEEAETLCYYIREKLMNYVNEDRSPTRDFYKERKRSRRRNRCESGLSSRSPDSTNEAAPESEQKKTHARRNHEPGATIGIMETSFTTQTRNTSVNNGLSHNNTPGEMRVSRPSYGLPQRQDTYGGPAETLLDTTARLQAKPSCHAACETQSPQFSVKGRRLDGEHCTKSPDLRNRSRNAESSFVHKDAYREGKGGRVRNSKRSADRDKITDNKSEKPGECRGFLLENSLCMDREQRSNTTKTCPCKYRGKRSPRGRKSRSPENARNPQEASLESNTQPIERNEAPTQRESSPLRTEFVANGDNVPLIDKTRPRDGLRSHDQEQRTIVNSQIKMHDGCHSPNRTRPHKGGFPPENKLQDTRNRSRDENWSRNEREPVVVVRSRDERSSIDDGRPRDERRSADDVISRGERISNNVQTAESSSDNSTEISQSSSWKEQTPLVSSNCYRSLHEWGSKRELSTNAMLDVMQGQELITCENSSNITEPSSPGKNIGSPEHEVVHRHEHHHYHYHIFKRS